MDSWTLRAAGAADTEFLYRVYASTRREELAPALWSAAQTEAFLRSQFSLQDRHYRRHYPAARFDIVQAWGEPAGRLYVDRSSDEICVLDIALLPAFRRRGLGRSLLSALLAEAAAAAQRVSLHVERNNPALGLYRQLGFEVVDDQQGVYLQMHWHAPPCHPALRPAEPASLSA
jgi:ribosomal protein S18 acetylase RimI-like enzyme